ncbi:hypothetical protein BKA69DRAFT_1071835 [Paraphysoderma sedebokerense]|nr:hypothetical protein BKA69DRAFT_1071835 [Paraphysoderma sedebokerense]
MGLFSYFFSSNSAFEQSKLNEQYASDLETVPRKNTICYHVEGFLSCEFMKASLRLSQKMANAPPKKEDTVHVDTNVFDKDQFMNTRLKELKKEVPGSNDHNTCPFIWEGCEPREYKFIGGYKQLAEIARNRHKLEV